MAKRRSRKPREGKTPSPDVPHPSDVSRAKSQVRANRLYRDLLNHPGFQYALQEIRAQFGIKEGATPEEQEAWYERWYGPWRGCEPDRGDDEPCKSYPFLSWWKAEEPLKNDPALHRLQKEVERFQKTIFRKYRVPVVVEWTLVHPFDHAVKAALRALGLDYWGCRDLFINRLWGEKARVQFVLPSLVGPIIHNPDGTLHSAILTVTPYDSERDVINAVRWVKSLPGQAVKALAHRPSKSWLALELDLLKRVLENDERPRRERLRRKVLLKALWQETRGRGLHQLSETRFRTLFYALLKKHHLVKRYVRE